MATWSNAGPDTKAARSELSGGGKWTLVALHRAVRHAYPHTEHGPRLAPASLQTALGVVSALHMFLCDEDKRAVDEGDPALALIDVADDLAVAACQVLGDDLNRARAARDA